MVNIVIAGSREFVDYKMLCKAVNRIIKKFYVNEEISIVSGCARGADKLGEIYANNNNYNIIRKPAEWDLYGKKAGAIRNEEMARIGNVLIAFWDMESRGTRSMISLANKYNLKVFVIDIRNRKILKDYIL